MLGEEITDPLVVNFQANVRFVGPTAAVEEWVGSARNIVQSLTLETGISVGFVVGVGVDGATGVGVVEGPIDGVELAAMAHS